jgi:hypothetical protein
VTGGQYVAAVYGVVFVFVLAYVAIIAAKLARLQRDTRELLDIARARPSEARSAEAVTREPTHRA